MEFQWKFSTRHVGIVATVKSPPAEAPGWQELLSLGNLDPNTRVFCMLFPFKRILKRNFLKPIKHNPYLCFIAQ